MTWISRFKEQMSSLGYVSSPQALARHETGDALTEEFRAAMLRLLPELHTDAVERMQLRISCAATLQSLWFLRSDMMALLSPLHGESEAMHKLDGISEPVREALPSGLRSRPSPLGRTSRSQ